MNAQGDQYEIIQKLGEGGMGTVYLAKDTLLDRLVAIKQLHRNSGAIEDGLGERFQAEALALAKLNHPNVTHLYAFIPKEDTYWMVMEFVEGKTLEDWLFIHKKITHQLASSIAVQMLDGLSHAHRKGIIHRDIKPANVMISEDGEVKIMDFGIARMRNAQRITSHGKSVGTLEYMAPEQIQGHEGDERTDVYAVGNILYEMLCGITPFKNDTDYQLMKDKLEKQPESIIRENPTVPEAFEKIILKALDRNPKKRFQSAKEMKSSIMKCLQGEMLDQSTLTIVLRESQVFTEPQKGNEIISVGKILSRAKSISGNLKVPKFKKIDKPFKILGATVLLCIVLLIWNANSEDTYAEEIPESPTITFTENKESIQNNDNGTVSGQFDQTPRRSPQFSVPEPEIKPKQPPKEKAKVVKKSSKVPSEKKSANNPPVEESTENIKENRTVARTPVDVPEGKPITVTLMEDITSEELERDGTLVQLSCNEDVIVENRIIIRKGAAVTGKIVDVVPSSNRRKKALIGFVIIKVEAVDGNSVKLKSERFRLFSAAPGDPVTYRRGQNFEAKLRRGRVN